MFYERSAKGKKQLIFGYYDFTIMLHFEYYQLEQLITANKTT